MQQPSGLDGPDDRAERGLIRAAGTLVARGGVPSVSLVAVEQLAALGDGVVERRFGGLPALLMATASTFAGATVIEQPVPAPAEGGGPPSVEATLARLVRAFRAYVDEDETRFSALLQFGSAAVFGERQYLTLIAAQHRRTAAAVSSHLAVLHRAGLTGVATADLATIAALFADTSRGIEMCHLLDRDEGLRETGYRELAQTLARRLANAPPSPGQKPRPASALIFEPDYRVRMVLEPSGVVRDLLIVEGVKGWNARDFIGRPVNRVAADVRLDPARDAVWRERLAEIWSQVGARPFREPGPGGEPDAVTTTLIPIHDAGGAPESILVEIEDRSGRLATQTEATAQEEQLRNALELTRLGTYIVYLREPVIVANDRFAEIYGCDPQQVMDDGGVEAYLELIHAEDRPVVRAALESAMTGEVDYVANYRLWIDTPDGPELRWISGLGRVEVDADGPIRVLGVIEDVTERHKQQEAILQSQKRDAIGTLAAGVAHDFNNVLGAILGNARAAERRLAAGEVPTDSLREITRGARRAGDLVDRLLSVSRDDHAPREPYLVAEVINEACGLMRPTLGLSVELRESVAPELPAIIGDATGLHQVLLNLIVNADYAIGADEGLIEIDADAVHLTHDGAGPGYGLPSGPYVRIRVRDNGPGFPKGTADRAFDPFFTTKPGGAGAGLGLAAAQTVIHNQGGSITLESVLGLGTAFTIHLPAELGPLPHSGPNPQTPARPADRPTPRVLFVDDETSLTDLAEQEMPSAGCLVVTESDPFAALDLLRAHGGDYDAVITDLAMPNLNGLGFVRYLRKFLPAIPVVLTSGYISDDAREHARRLGVGRILPKPCTIDELAAAVLELVDEHAV